MGPGGVVDVVDVVGILDGLAVAVVVVFPEGRGFSPNISPLRCESIVVNVPLLPSISLLVVIGVILGK